VLFKNTTIIKWFVLVSTGTGVSTERLGWVSDINIQSGRAVQAGPGVNILMVCGACVCSTSFGQSLLHNRVEVRSLLLGGTLVVSARKPLFVT
jgi:hypothetical protein